MDIRIALGALVASVGLAATAPAADLDFSNPAVALSGKAIVDSGACIAKYTVQLNDASQSVAAVAAAVAKRCDREISLSAGLAAFLAGNPADFSENLKYAREDLTAHAVERYRANMQSGQLAQLR
jgi:hypothetical protein